MSKRGQSMTPMEKKMRSAALEAATKLEMENYYKPKLQAQDGESLYAEPAALGDAANYDMAAGNLPRFLDALEDISFDEQSTSGAEGHVVNKYIMDAMEQEYGKQAYLDVASKLLGLTKPQVIAQDKFITAIGEAVDNERAANRGVSLIGDAISSTDPDPNPNPNVMLQVANRLNPAIKEYVQAVPGADIGVASDHMNDVVQRMGGVGNSDLAKVMAGQSQQRAPQVMMGAAAWAAARAGQLSTSAVVGRKSRESLRGPSLEDQGYSSRSTSPDGPTVANPSRYKPPQLSAATAGNRLQVAQEELCNKLSSFVTDALKEREPLSAGKSHQIEGVNITKTDDGTRSSPSKYQVEVAGCKVKMSRSKRAGKYSDFTSTIVSDGTGKTVEQAITEAAKAVEAINKARPALDYTEIIGAGDYAVPQDAIGSRQEVHAVATAPEHATVQGGGQQWSIPFKGGASQQPNQRSTHELVPAGGYRGSQQPNQRSTHELVRPGQGGWASKIRAEAATQGDIGRGD